MGEPYQHRAAAEKAELDEKLQKLDIFIRGDAYKALPGIEQVLLLEQALYMAFYSAVLGRRIAAFGG